MPIISHLSQIMEEKGMTYEELQYRSKVAPDTVARARGVNPDWILTGEGVHYLRSAESEEPVFPAERVIEIRPPEQCSAQELVNELVRRALGERMGCETS